MEAIINLLFYNEVFIDTYGIWFGLGWFIITIICTWKTAWRRKYFYELKQYKIYLTIFYISTLLFCGWLVGIVSVPYLTGYTILYMIFWGTVVSYLFYWVGIVGLSLGNLTADIYGSYKHLVDGTWDHLAAEECKLKNIKTFTRATQRGVPFYPIDVHTVRAFGEDEHTKDCFESKDTQSNNRESSSTVRAKREETEEKSKGPLGFGSLAEDYAIGTITGLF